MPKSLKEILESEDPLSEVMGACGSCGSSHGECECGDMESFGDTSNVVGEEDSCPDCGAPVGMECDPRCPNAGGGEFEPASGVFKHYNELDEDDGSGFEPVKSRSLGSICHGCGADAGQQCAPDCPNRETFVDESDDQDDGPKSAYTHDPFKNKKRIDLNKDDDVPPSSVAAEGLTFDKHMDKILIQEGHNRIQPRQEDSPQRRRAARHQDRPLNKIRLGGR